MHVFAKTLRDQRRGLTGWGIGLAATIAAMAVIWPSFSDADFNAVLEKYPPELLDIFNVRTMSTGTGFLNAELFSVVVPVMFVVYAVGRGARTIAGEEESGVLAMVLTMPVHRTTVLAGKAVGLVAGVGVLALVVAVSMAVASPLSGMDLSVQSIVRGAATQWFIGVEFGLIALAVAAATGRTSLAVGVPAGLAAATYLAFLAAQLVDGLAWLRWLSPFHAATVGGPLGPGLPWVVFTMPAVGTAAVAVSAPLFARRDIAG